MGLKSTLFGKPPTTDPATSDNRAYDAINSAFSPGFKYFTQGGDMLGNMLGVGGGAAQTDALNNFANSGGMQFLMDQGTKAITSSKAAQGLLKSGSYGEALDKYGQGLASTYLNQYMDDLMNYSKLGLGAGSLVAQAGQESKGSQQKPGKQGILPILAQVGMAAATGGASVPFSAGMDFSGLGSGLNFGTDFGSLAGGMGNGMDFSGLGAGLGF